MEKQEARIKCTGCGSSYKLKVPVTDKPVNFKCKKCGKVLKVKVTTASEQEQEQAAAPPAGDATIQGFETTQLPELDGFFDSGGSGGGKQSAPSPGGFQLDPTLALFTTDRAGGDGPKIKPTLDETVRIPEPVFEQGYADQLFPQPKAAKQAAAQAPAPARTRGSERRWLALDDEQVRGPYTDNEVVSMIEDGEIDSETPLRMGQRPWIKAEQVADFKHCFHKGKPIRRGTKQRMDPMQSEALGEPEEPELKETPFYEEFGLIAPYPLEKSNLIPVGIFAGVAVALCAILSLDFLIGLPVCIAGWTLLYGYLITIREKTKMDPQAPLPPWNFSQAKELVLSGAKVFAVLALFSLLPVTLCLLVMIACFLNGMTLFGYLAIVLTILVFMASLFVAPAALILQDAGQGFGSALSPAKVMRLIARGKTSYKMLALTSIGGGLACMVVVLLAVFLVDIPVAGFVVAGVVMGLVLTYFNLIWFRVLGRFSRENSRIVALIV
jgi:hypothetical protein